MYALGCKSKLSGVGDLTNTQHHTRVRLAVSDVVYMRDSVLIVATRL
jgi:hypothetical protein